jgi:Zn-finger nucleic acid-binding protein
MKCPNCNATLLMTTRQEVEIDYCPECRGIWLDRGELDKIISRTRAAEQASERAEPSAASRFDDSSDEYTLSRRDRENDHYDPHTGKHKRKSAASRLSDLFDLF